MTIDRPGPEMFRLFVDYGICALAMDSFSGCPLASRAIHGHSNIPISEEQCLKLIAQLLSLTCMVAA